jgi:hypothetical protein
MLHILKQISTERGRNKATTKFSAAILEAILVTIATFLYVSM